MYTNVSQEELDQELRNEDREVVQDFINSFVDEEADALPIDIQIRRVIKARMGQ